MNIGDNIICIEPCIMLSDKRHVTTVNKIYKVEKINYRSYFIIDDESDSHSFDLKTFNKKGGFFCDLKHYRKLKIKKLNERG